MGPQNLYIRLIVIQAAHRNSSAYYSFSLLGANVITTTYFFPEMQNVAILNIGPSGVAVLSQLTYWWPQNAAKCIFNIARWAFSQLGWTFEPPPPGWQTQTSWLELNRCQINKSMIERGCILLSRAWWSWDVGCWFYLLILASSSFWILK